MRYIHYLRYIIGGILLFSGLLKITSLTEFYLSLTQYEYISVLFGNYLSLTARIFVIFEIIIGILMITGIWKRRMLISAGILFLLFLTISIYDHFSEHINTCVCFGSLHISALYRIIGNSAILIALLTLYFKDNSLQLKNVFIKRIVFITGCIILLVSIYSHFRVQDNIEYNEITNTIKQLTVLDESYNRILLHNLLNSSTGSILFIFSPIDCIVCFKRINELNELANEYNLKMVGIALDTYWDELRDLLYSLNISFDVYIKNNLTTNEMLRTTPMISIITSDGDLIYLNYIPTDYIRRNIVYDDVIYTVNSIFHNQSYH